MKKHIQTLHFTSLCTLTFAFCCLLLLTLPKNEHASPVLNVNAASEDTKTIMIDAGHGGYDTGSISANHIYEKDITLQIALKTGKLLEEAGYQVLYSRTSDEVTWPADNKTDLQARIDLATIGQADYFISVHLNASDYEDGARGFEIYTSGEDTNIEEIANAMMYKLDRLDYSINRGIKTTQERPLYVIDQNPIPAMLIEFGFITDSDDMKFMLSKEGQTLFATCIMESIQLYS